MGIILFFGILFALYLIDKVLMAITAVVMIIYIIVRKAKKKKIGKIIILPIVILIVLELLSLPADLLTVSANIEAIKYNNQLETRDHGLTKDLESNTFTYHGKKYVNLTDELTNVIGDGRYRVYMDNSENFEVLAPLVIEENVKKGFQWFFFTSNESTIYTLKNSPDQKILYSDFSGKVWCLEEEFENAKKIYNDKTNYDYYIVYKVGEVEKEQKISLEVYSEILNCEQKDYDGDFSYFNAEIPDKESVDIYAKSKDGRVIHEYICEELATYNGKLYYYYASQSGRYLNVKLKQQFCYIVILKKL